MELTMRRNAVQRCGYVLGPAVLLLVVCLSSHVVAAQEAPGTGTQEVNQADQEARGRFDAGNAAYDAGQFEEALEQYQKALALVVPREHPEVLRNIILTLTKLGRDNEALVYAEMLRAAGWESMVPKQGASLPTEPKPPVKIPAPAKVGLADVQTPGQNLKMMDGSRSREHSWQWKNLYSSRMGTWYGWVGKYVAYVFGIIMVIFGVALLDDDGPVGCLPAIIGLAAAIVGGWLL